MTVTQGTAADRLTLVNGSDDLVARDVSGEAIVARLRAAAWARRLVVAGKSPIALVADTEPAARGGNFVIGRDNLQFAVKANRQVWYLVLDVDPQGRLVTLWPTSDAEDVPAPAGAVQTFGRTEATDPAGLDHVVVLAFPAKPEGIESWYSLSATFGSAEATGLVQWLAGQDRAYAAATIDVRTIHACQIAGVAPCAP